jgi:hypothetical protein
MTQYTLHKLPEGFIVTSDEELENGDAFLSYLIEEDEEKEWKVYKVFTALNVVSTPVTDTFSIKTISSKETGRSGDNTKHYIFELDTCFKVIAKQDQINFSALSEEEQKEIGWFDIEKLATQYENIEYKDVDHYDPCGYSGTDYNLGFQQGFQEAQQLLSDKMFTLEDVIKAYQTGYNAGAELDKYAPRNSSEFIKSLSRPKSWKVEGHWKNNEFKITKVL